MKTTDMNTDGNDGAFADGGQIGLTKREYFAAMAMQGLLSDQARSGGYSTFANKAVSFADALIEALNKSNETNE